MIVFAQCGRTTHECQDVIVMMCRYCRPKASLTLPAWRRRRRCRRGGFGNELLYTEVTQL